MWINQAQTSGLIFPRHTSGLGAVLGGGMSPTFAQDEVLTRAPDTVEISAKPHPAAGRSPWLRTAGKVAAVFAGAAAVSGVAVAAGLLTAQVLPITLGIAGSAALGGAMLGLAVGKEKSRWLVGPGMTIMGAGLAAAGSAAGSLFLPLGLAMLGVQGLVKGAALAHAALKLDK